MKQKSVLIKSILVALFILSNCCVFAEPFKSVKDQAQVFFINPYLKKDYFSGHNVIYDWSWQRVYEKSDRDLLIPPETGRGVIIPEQYNPFTTVFLKGTGLNPEHSGKNNKIRYNVNAKNEEEVFFDGQFRLRQGVFDVMNSEFLQAAGVLTARPLGLVSLGSDPKIGHEIGIYAREFQIQTRLSNLHAVTADKIRNDLDDAIDLLFKQKLTKHKLDYVEYFFWFSHLLARQAARMQAIGFEHGVLHSQQITLAGELTDLATGRWLDDESIKNWGTKPKQKYFQFDRQPILFQNMLVRTHSVTSDPPVQLEINSETRRHNTKALLGAIEKADPVAYQKIMDLEPVKYFWRTFDHYYQTFDDHYFKSHFKPRDHFVISATEYLESFPITQRSKNRDIVEDAFRTLTEKLQLSVLPRQLVFDFLLTRLSAPDQIEAAKNPKAFGDADRELVYTEKMVRRFSGLKKPNYFLDETTRLENFIEPYEVISGQEVPVFLNNEIKGVKVNKGALSTPWSEESVDIPEEAWRVKIKGDKELETFVDAFRVTIQKIKQQYGALDSPEAIKAVLYAIAVESQIKFGYHETDKKAQFEEHLNRRWKTDVPLFFSEILNLDCGLCTETATLAFILGKAVQEIEPRYRLRVLKTQHLVSTGHFFLSVTAPNNRLYVIDPMAKPNQLVGPYTAFITKSYNADYYEWYSRFQRIVPMARVAPGTSKNKCLGFYRTGH